MFGSVNTITGPTQYDSCPASGSDYAIGGITSWEFDGERPNEISTKKITTFHYDQVADRVEDDSTGPTCDKVANPVDPLSGNKYEEEVDYRGTGVLPLEFIRTYNSHTNNWKFSYDANFSNGQLVLDDGTRKAMRSIPAAQFATYSGAPCPTCPPSGYVPNTADVVPVDDYQYHATVSGTQVRFTRPDGMIETFDTANGGRLARRENATGQALTFTYTSGRLTRVSHFSGRRINLTYDAQGRLATMADPSNRITTYTWDTQNRL